MNLLEKEKKASQMITPLFFDIMVAAIAFYVVIYATPVIGELPVEITEDVEIVGITGKGIVVETSFDVPVTTSQYGGQIGDVIEVTYSVPTKYLEDMEYRQARYDAFIP
ncbi:MAG: hypothetical protein ACR2LL_04255 [Nitrosopumilus sp.]